MDNDMIDVKQGSYYRDFTSTDHGPMKYIGRGRWQCPRCDDEYNSNGKRFIQAGITDAASVLNLVEEIPTPTGIEIQHRHSYVDGDGNRFGPMQRDLYPSANTNYTCATTAAVFTKDGIRVWEDNQSDDCVLVAEYHPMIKLVHGGIYLDGWGDQCGPMHLKAIVHHGAAVLVFECPKTGDQYNENGTSLANPLNDADAICAVISEPEPVEPVSEPAGVTVSGYRIAMDGDSYYTVYLGGGGYIVMTDDVGGEICIPPELVQKLIGAITKLSEAQ